jgi:hypothetical protein
MPAPRGTTALCDEVELLGEALEDLIVATVAAASDGVFDEAERRLLRVQAAEVRTHFQPLPGRICEVDDVMRLIGCAAHAGRASKKVLEIARQAHNDARALALA